MKSFTRKFNWLPALIAIAILAVSPRVEAYSITLMWESGYDPLVFAIGPFLPGDLSNLDDIHIEDINPFFASIIVDNPASPDNLYLHLALATGAGQFVFRTRTDNRIDVRQNILGRHNNREIANIEGMQFQDIDSDNVLGFLDGGNLRQGMYFVTMILSSRESFEDAVQNNDGIGVMSMLVQNPSQVSLEIPNNNSTLTTPPVFMWGFPRQSGVSFLLQVVRGNPNDNPSDVMESPNPSNVYGEIPIDVPDWMGRGQLTTHIFTGTGQGEQSLVEGTYFWRVTATGYGVFPNDFQTFESPIFSFAYDPPGADGGGGGDGGDGGGGGGGDQENDAPVQLSPIFEALRRCLTDAQFQTIVSQFGDPSQWQLQSITIGEDQTISMQDLLNFLLSNDRHVALVAVTQ